MTLSQGEKDDLDHILELFDYAYEGLSKRLGDDDFPATIRERTLRLLLINEVRSLHYHFEQLVEALQCL